MSIKHLGKAVCSKPYKHKLGRKEVTRNQSLELTFLLGWFAGNERKCE